MKKFLNKILDIIFPKECLGCRVSKTLLCHKCLKKLPWPNENENNRTFAATSYASILVKKLIKALKYRGIKQLAQPFAKLIYDRLFSPGTPRFHEIKSHKDFVFIPIPLSKKRLKKRGFNQAQLIAQALSDKLGNKPNVLSNVLYRVKDVAPQADIKEREKRLENMKNVFSVKNPDLIQNKVIVVIDDVSTTSATINEARRALKNAGAKKIIGVVVAK